MADSTSPLLPLFTKLSCEFTCASIKLYDSMIFFVISINGNNLYLEIYDHTSYKSYDDKNICYDKNIKNILNDIPEYLSIIQIPIHIIHTLVDEINVDHVGDAGFDKDTEIDIANYKTDLSFWKSTKLGVNVSRSITITSFGNKYTGFDALKKTFDCSFNALCVRSKVPRGFSLKKIRGTDEIMQHVVEGGKGFNDFIRFIVSKVEENNYTNIGIFCRAGHHRSVACVELLAKYIYSNAKVKHLNL